MDANDNKVFESLSELKDCIKELGSNLYTPKKNDIKDTTKSIKGSFWHGQYGLDSTPILDDGAFKNEDLDGKWPKKPSVETCDCLLVFLIICMFVPLAVLLLHLNMRTDNNAVLDNNKTTTSSIIIVDSTNNKSFGANKDVGNSIHQLKDDAHLKHEEKTNSVTENKQKVVCCQEVLLGISTIVLTIIVFCVILAYVKYLKKKCEQEYLAEDKYFEFNKKVYCELLQIKTADAIFKKQAKEIALEMYKKAELLRFDELQKCYEHDRQCDFKSFDLLEKYTKELFSTTNKFYETNKIDRKEKDLKVDVTKGANIDSINITL